jgi:hypothetical protein
MGKLRNPEVRSVYWGPFFPRTEIEDVLDNVKTRYILHYTGDKTLNSAVQLLRAARLLAGSNAPRSLVRGPLAIAAFWLRRGRNTFPKISTIM